MTGQDDKAAEEAAAWHARVAAPDMDWEAFTMWLEADPGNSSAYDAVAQVDDEVTRWAIAHGMTLPQPLPKPANDSGPGRWRLGIGSVAAALVVAVAVPTILKQPPTATLYATDRVTQRTVALGPGNRVQLDRSSRMAVAADHPGRVRLDAGAAYFQIRHDPAQRFVVRSGDVTITDIGTRFTVTRAADRTTVAVQEGFVAVAYRGGRSVKVGAGQTLDVPQTGRLSPVRAIDPAAIGSWRAGRLIYDNAPLAVVAADASRYERKALVVDPSVADLRLSGILLIGDGSHLVDQIQAFLPVEAREEGDHLRLVRVARRR